MQVLGLLGHAHPSVVNRLQRETEALERAMGRSTGGWAHCSIKHVAADAEALGDSCFLDEGQAGAPAASWGADSSGPRWLFVGTCHHTDI